jgi:hypothetical protein
MEVPMKSRIVKSANARLAVFALAAALLVGSLGGCASGARAAEPPLPDGVAASKSGPGESLPFEDRFSVNNNEWNAQAASKPYSETVFTGASGGKDFFGWSWSWRNSNPYTVLSYPEVFLGQSPWAPGSKPMGFSPFTVGGHTLRSSFDIEQTTSPIGGWNTYDLTYDIWILKSGTDLGHISASDIKCELMLWIDSRNAIPDGLSPAGALEANGRRFNFYCNPSQSSGTSYSWIYAAFSATKPLLKCADFDITPFLTYLVDRGLIGASDYVSTVELGTEVAVGSGRTIVRDYSVTIGP